MSVHTAAVKSIIKDFSIEYSASDPEDLAEDKVIGKLKASNY